MADLCSEANLCESGDQLDEGGLGSLALRLGNLVVDDIVYSVIESWSAFRITQI